MSKSKYDHMSKAQLQAELNRVAGREERLKNDLKDYKKFDALSHLDEPTVQQLGPLFDDSLTNVQIAEGLRGIAENYDPSPQNTVVEIEPEIEQKQEQKQEQEIEIEGEGDSNMAETTIADWLPNDNNDPQFNQKLAKLREAVNQQQQQKREEAMINRITEQVVAAMSQRENEARAMTNRDRLAQPLLEAGYSPENDTHVDALNLGLQLRAQGKSPEQVLQAVQAVYPIEPIGNTPQEVTAAVAADVTAQTAPTPTAPSGINDGTVVSANLPHAPTVASAGTLSSDAAPSGDSAESVPPINSPEFRAYMNKNLSQLEATPVGVE